MNSRTIASSGEGNGVAENTDSDDLDLIINILIVPAEYLTNNSYFGHIF